MWNRFANESRTRSSPSTLSSRELTDYSAAQVGTEMKSRDFFSISPLLILRAAITWEWLSSNDVRSTGLKQQLQGEMSQIGLLSALMLTIVSAFLMLFYEPRDYSQWQIGASVIIWTVAFTLMLMSTVNSVLLLLAINVCRDDEECKQLTQRLGKLKLFPAQAFHISILIAIDGIILWAFILLERTYFYIVVGTSASLYCFQTCLYWKIIHCVFSVKEQAAGT